MKRTENPINVRVPILMTANERAALERLAEHDGISMGNVVRNAVRALAKRKKVWK